MSDQITCRCGEPVPVANRENHLRRHAEWERQATRHTATVSKMDTVDVTAIMVTLDQLIAYAHGGPKPVLTMGAQGWLAANAREGT